MNKFSKTCLMLGVALSVSYTQAAQIVEKAYEQSVPVSASNSELNILTVEGRKIRNVIPSYEDALEYQADVEQGVFYFKISPFYQNRTISLVVNDDLGARYKLILRPVSSLGAEEIILKAPVQREESGKGSQSFIQQIKELIYVMGDDADQHQQQLAIDGINRSDVNQQIPLWQEANMVYVARYDADELYGEHYQVTNITNQNLVLLEQEFYRKKVVAVSIENLNLLPNQTTNVYVVREQ